MNHREVFEKCKDLALKYGYKREKGNSLRSYYVDGFGIGLQIDYYYQAAKTYVDNSQGCTDDESIRVYLGGRELYTYTKKHDKEFYCDDSNWYDLVVELLYIELKTGLEENAYVDKNMLDFYRTEAEKNRKIFSDFTAVCIDVVKAKGVLDNNFSDSCYYKFVTQVSEKELKLFFKDSLINKDIAVRYDGKIIFSYCWDQLRNTGIEREGYFDLFSVVKVKKALDLYCS